MVKTALKVYKKNIWEIFSIIGIVAIGLLAGLLIIVPNIINTTSSTYRNIVDTISKYAKEYGATFDTNKFLTSLGDQLKVLDWANPIQALNNLFSDNNLLRIVGTAFEKAGLSGDHLQAAVLGVKSTVDGYIVDLTNQIWILVGSIASGALVSYILTKIIIRARSTKYHHVGWFILSLILNLLNLALIYYISYVITMRVTNKVAFCFALLGDCILMYVLTFLNAVICYKPKQVKTKHIFNVKNLFLLFLSNLIILAISVVIIVVVAIFSDAVAIVLSLPLLLLTSIVTECVVISYTEEVAIKTLSKDGSIPSTLKPNLAKAK